MHMRYEAIWLALVFRAAQCKPTNINTTNSTVSELTWPVGGIDAAVPDRNDMSLRFTDLPSELDIGSGITSIDIQNSAEIYIQQLKIEASNPFRGLNFPIWDTELDCRCVGTVYAVRPAQLPTGDWHFSIKDTIDALKGIEKMALSEMGLQETDVLVLVAGREVAKIRVLNQFRGTEPEGEKCLGYAGEGHVVAVA